MTGSASNVSLAASAKIPAPSNPQILSKNPGTNTQETKVLTEARTKPHESRLHVLTQVAEALSSSFGGVQEAPAPQNTAPLHITSKEDPSENIFVTRNGKEVDPAQAKESLDTTTSTPKRKNRPEESSIRLATRSSKRRKQSPQQDMVDDRLQLKSKNPPKKAPAARKKTAKTATSKSSTLKKTTTAKTRRRDVLPTKKEMCSTNVQPQDVKSDEGLVLRGSVKYTRLSWDERYDQLVAFQRENGHLAVPGTEEFLTLHHWIAKQRRDGKKLRPDQIKRLEKIGFDWDREKFGPEQRWNTKFQRLKAYIRKHGHANVPRPKAFDTSNEDHILGNWVQWQRLQFKKNKLSQDRVDKLNEVGFAWSLREGTTLDTSTFDNRWMETYTKLEEFHRQHGHCVVPYSYNDQLLAGWVRTQRTRFREGRLREERQKKLDDLGFVWKIDYSDPSQAQHQRNWERMFQQLVRFKEEHGHTKVTARNTDDKVFFNWVALQRRLFRTKDSGLSGNRLERLNSIDFWWNEERKRTFSKRLNEESSKAQEA